MSNEHQATVQLLAGVLDDVLGEERPALAWQSVLEAAAQCTGESGVDAGAELVHALDDEQIVQLLGALTLRFHMVNKAEQMTIARINRQRERVATPECPRVESIAEAVLEMKRAGRSLDDVIGLLGRLDIQPTLTAHPTEARRRTILRKQQRLVDLVNELREGDPTPLERGRIEDRLKRIVMVLLGTDDVRTERLHVLEEVRNGLFYLTGSIWETVPTLYADLRDALRDVYGSCPQHLPIVIRYRSWIGGDRDGNPNVTPEVTRATLDLMRDEAIGLHTRDLWDLRHFLSLSDRKIEIPTALRESIERDLDAFPALREADSTRHLMHEPFRLKIHAMIARIATLSCEDPVYDTDRYIEDLEVIGDALRDAGQLSLVGGGPLENLLIRARTFGFHLAALDVRQHSGRHEQAVDEILRIARVHESYESLDERGRVDLLSRELTNPRPLLAPGAGVSEDTGDALETFTVCREAVMRDKRSIGSGVVSMTHDVSDMLETLVLMKEAGLYREAGGGAVSSDMDLVPLFETINDLKRAPVLMRELYANDAYKPQLDARGGFQEIMLGYSDSNKDGGYVMANWSLQTAQHELARVNREHGIDFRFFHGRGGTVGRGGGRANRAILATPNSARTARLRMTEQGEVISFRYSLPAIARRHLEQVIGAMLLAAPSGENDQPVKTALDPSAEDIALVERLAVRAMERYRELIDHDSFWDWFARVTPIEYISHLPIASRPVSRSGGVTGIDNLRAIPWVFAWTQVRGNIPGWFGIGTALGELSDEVGEDTVREMYARWAFFRAMVENAELELARARPHMLARYARGIHSEIERLIEEECERSVRWINRVTGSTALLDTRPVIQRTIRDRNPYADVLQLMQLELLSRARERGGADDALRRALFLSINGIAAAMQSTG